MIERIEKSNRKNACSKHNIKYKILFNHDGFCVFSTRSRYQDIKDLVSLKQVYGYVDEVADSGCDVLLLQPMLNRIPMWRSKVYPYWQEEGLAKEVPNNSFMERVYNRVKAVVLNGNDFVKLSLDRAHEKGIAFFISWRMNECHDCTTPNSPIQSRFWLNHPEYRIGNPSSSRWSDQALSFVHKEVRDDQFNLTCQTR